MNDNHPPRKDLVSTSMSALWAASLGAGDKVTPIDLWNKTERGPNRLPAECVIECVIRQPSQTGFTLVVADVSGKWKSLDAAWFKVPSTFLVRPKP